MCGLIGVIGLSKLKAVNNYSVKRLLVEHMFILSSFRGLDSTGWFSVDKQAKITHDKRTLNPWDYLNSLYWDNTARKIIYDAEIFIGHTRKATIGGINIATAHPFDEEYVIGVHNGTLSDWKNIDDEDAISDSHAVMSKLSKTDAKDIKSVLEQLDGAYALIWYDKQEDILYLARNKERPLWLGKTQEGVILLASEQNNIKFSTERLGVVVEEYKELPVGELYSIPLADIKKDIEFTVEKFKPYEAPPVKYFQSNNQGAKSYWNSYFNSEPVDVYTSEEEEIFKKFNIDVNKSFGFRFTDFDPFHTIHNGKQFGTLYGIAFNKVSKKENIPIKVMISGIDLEEIFRLAKTRFPKKDFNTKEHLKALVFSGKPGFAFYDSMKNQNPCITVYKNTFTIQSVMNTEGVANESQVH